MAPSWLSLPNALTLSRVPLAACGAAYLWARRPWVGLGFLVAAYLTDVLDGFFARRAGRVTDFGKAADPLADKIATAGVGLVLVIRYGVPWWLLGAAVARDAAIVVAGLILYGRLGEVPTAEFWGKAAACAMVVYALAVIISPWPTVTLSLQWAVLALIVISAFAYSLKLFWILSRRRVN